MTDIHTKGKGSGCNVMHVTHHQQDCISSNDLFRRFLQCPPSPPHQAELVLNIAQGFIHLDGGDGRINPSIETL